MENLWKGTIVLVASFLAPVKGIVIATIVVVLFDLLTGVYASWKESIPITSNKLGKIIPKLLLYNLTILCVYLLDQHILGEFVLFFSNISLFATKIIGMAIFMVEFTSIINNVERSLKIQFLPIFRGWMKTIRTEASNVSAISDDVANISRNIRRSGKDPEDRNGHLRGGEGHFGNNYNYFPPGETGGTGSPLPPEGHPPIF